MPCAIKIGESNKLGRHGIRFIVSLRDAISGALQRQGAHKKAPSTWNKNHKTQFTMVNGKVPGEVESH